MSLEVFEIPKAKCLLISPTFPVDSFGGANIRVARITQVLSRRFGLTVLVLQGEAHLDYERSLKFCESVGARLIVLPQVRGRVGRLSRFVNLLRSISPFIEKALATKLPKFIRKEVDSVDLLFVCQPSSFSRWAVPKRVLLLLDIFDLDEWTFPESYWVKSIARSRMIRFQRQRVMNRSIVSLVCSEDDKLRLGKCDDRTIRTLPNTYDLERSAPIDLDSKSVVLFVGRFVYYPNLEAAQWLLEEIWPQVAEVSSLKLEIVGPGSEKLNTAGLESVETFGQVKEIAPYLNRALMTVVPLKRGSGTRVKILESWSYGIPVVSTSVGSEGLPVSSGSNIVLADTADEFISAILYLSNKQGAAINIGASGWKTYVERCSPVVFDLQLSEIVNEVIHMKLVS